MTKIIGLGNMLAIAAMSAMGLSEYGIRAIVDEDERPRPKPAERFRPTLEAEAERVKKAQEKRARKAAKLRRDSGDV